MNLIKKFRFWSATSGLKSSSPRQRLAAVKTLGDIGTTEAIDPLIVALDPRDKECSENAALQLQRIGNSEVVRALIDAVCGRSWQGQGHDVLCNLLARIGGGLAINALAEELQSDHQENRRAAAEALATSYDSLALDALTTFVRGKHTFQFSNCVESVEALGKSRSSRAVIDTLIWVVANDNKSERYWAKAAIRALSELNATAELVTLASDKSVSALFSSNLISALEESHAVDALLAMARREKGCAKALLFGALGRRKATAAVPLLIDSARKAQLLLKNLTDKAPPVVRDIGNAAVHALGEIADKRAIDVLLSIVNEGTQLDDHELALALARLGHQQRLGRWLKSQIAKAKDPEDGHRTFSLLKSFVDYNSEILPDDALRELADLPSSMSFYYYTDAFPGFQGFQKTYSEDCTGIKKRAAEQLIKRKSS